jgi:hypothetical protein
MKEANGWETLRKIDLVAVMALLAELPTAPSIDQLECF